MLRSPPPGLRRSVRGGKPPDQSHRGEATVSLDSVSLSSVALDATVATAAAGSEESEPLSPSDEGAVGGVDVGKEAGKGRQVRRLGDDVYGPWGGSSSVSRSSSDTGSETATCKGGPGKRVCGQPVKDGERGVSCDICRCWYHSVCQAVSRNTFKSLETDEMLGWFCAECKVNMSKRDLRQGHSQPYQCECPDLVAKVEQLEALVRKNAQQLEALLLNNTQLIKNMHDKQEQSVAKQTELATKATEEALAKCQSSYAEAVKGSYAKVVESVSAKIDAIPKQVQTKPSVDSAQQIAGAFDNFFDKEKRKLNVVVHNLPESSGESFKEKSEKDAEQFTEMIREVLKLNVRVTKAFRVGKGSEDKPRLLVITLENAETKMDVLKMASGLRHHDQWSNIYVTPDLTWQEREEGRKLRQELARRKGEGKPNLAIRRGKIVALEPRAQQGATGQGPAPQEVRLETTAGSEPRGSVGASGASDAGRPGHGAAITVSGTVTGEGEGALAEAVPAGTGLVAATPLPNAEAPPNQI